MNWIMHSVLRTIPFLLLYIITIVLSVNNVCDYVENRYIKKCGEEYSLQKSSISISVYRCALKCDVNCKSFSVNVQTGACVNFGQEYTCSFVSANFGTGLVYYEMLSRNNCADHCASNPCLNSGVCVNTGHSGYSCVCQGWYTGTNCEQDMLGLEVVCDWHHGKVYVDGLLKSSQSSHIYPYFHRVNISESSQVLAFFCEDDQLFGGNDYTSYLAVSLSNGEATGVSNAWKCTSGYQAGWMDVNHIDTSWVIPNSYTLSSSYWSINDFIYRPVTSYPKWTTISTMALYCRYDRRLL